MSFTNQMLNDRKEKDCIGIIHERKYYRSGVSFIKRSLRPKEWQLLKENSTIPIPHLYCCFEDDDAVYLVMEYVEGVSMDRLTEDQKARVENEFVFCHNDLSQNNVIVDPNSLKIRAIIDWEYAGFYPAYFDRSFFRRKGPSVAIDGEIDDSEILLDFLYCVCKAP
ncbi:hypothetical protein H112_02171 [Trichophyton rubrum D6]|uniref:Aminoglycoside phosphotransferase domain-containing protein n=2 Tax=Trichophyton TaxID=5550 RepID=A0A022WA74_TRIRU|nr:hypothetical protein H100_02168 [Trichophyton rubrum MR850]EZF44567.1 hypothetical protein H102_02166 [Trichophyton rubrum CBS 100081]EZF55204.1 hypothetical protein H103_02175 [Trichophyton rubrum CBS 288.86]EZF65839.1 hypothetical protein H104_02151 [Trichophyton rubrum CBS 289.86]EZF76422.1 hypothetical protein H105_02185 [Trichophyton soudanense CBS 452.61]EZF87099.1 hypothetical protein H110_02171 [Trichophyton rubrum MR1448]EZF97979.1 hypothetical protein H113_02174 [Trichophyton rub